MVTQKQSEFRRNKNENSNELVRLESSLLLNSTECIAVAGDYHGKLMPRRKYSFTLKIRPALLSTEKSHEECLKSQRKLLIIGWALRITENDILTSNLRKSLYLLPTSSYTATGRRQNSLVHAGIPNHIRYFCYQIIIILIIFKMIIIFWCDNACLANSFSFSLFSPTLLISFLSLDSERQNIERILRNLEGQVVCTSPPAVLI